MLTTTQRYTIARSFVQYLAIKALNLYINFYYGSAQPNLLLRICTPMPSGCRIDESRNGTSQLQIFAHLFQTRGLISSSMSKVQTRGIIKDHKDLWSENHNLDVIEEVQVNL